MKVYLCVYIYRLIWRGKLLINNPWNFDYNLDREEQRVDIIFTEGIVEVVLQRDSLVAPFLVSRILKSNSYSIRFCVEEFFFVIGRPQISSLLSISELPLHIPF